MPEEAVHIISSVRCAVLDCFPKTARCGIQGQMADPTTQIAFRKFGADIFSQYSGCIGFDPADNIREF